MIRVAILHNHPIHYSHLLFTAMSEGGAEVDVVFAAKSSDERTTSLQPLGSTYKSHFLSDGSFQSLPQIKTALRAIEALAACRPDVVVIGGYSYLAAWSSLWWAKLHRKPVVLWSETHRGSGGRRPVKESIKRLFVMGCNAGHVYGKSSRAYLEELGMKSSAIAEKRAVVDTEQFFGRRAGFHAEFRRFVFVGRFVAEKNLLCILDAFARVHKTCRAELLLVGYGPLEPDLGRRVEELSLDASVVFVGACHQDRVCQLMAESDCLVLFSKSEPWGLVVNEAQCVGLPVIVSDRCGCAPDLVHQDTGWVVESDNVRGLAETMEAVCRMGVGELKRMGAAARRIAVEYSPAASANRVLMQLRNLTVRG